MKLEANAAGAGGSRVPAQLFESPLPTPRLFPSPRRLVLLALILLVAGCASSPPPADPKPRQRPDGPPVRLSLLIEELGLRWSEDEDGNKVLLTSAGHELRIEAARSTWDLDGFSRPVPPPGAQPDGSDLMVPEPVARRMREDVPAIDRTPARRRIAIQPRALEGKRIVIDAGHGGRDGGAVGGGSVLEKSITLDLSRRVVELLEAKNARVVATRADDRFIPLPERAAIANRGRADAFVSIHANSANNRAATGIEVWHPERGLRGQQSHALARELCRHLVRNTGAVNRGPKADRRGLAVLKHTTMPAALVEVGFLSNTEERARLADPAYRAKMAEAIVRGLERWFSDS